jgi:SAM-dependent methyltransferase
MGSEIDNQPQIAYWNGPASARWVRFQEKMDPAMRPFGEAAMAAVRPPPAARVLDVGCGCGDTTIALADWASGGTVLGVDVSAPMLERAMARAAGRAGISFVMGDAAKLPLEPASFDVVFSRFGVMFFADPVGAFRNLRAATRAGGRLSFVCWRELTDNPWGQIGLEVISAIAPAAPVDPDAPGPFSLRREARIRAILGDAGWADIEVTRIDRIVQVTRSADVGEAVEFYMNMGPGARLLAGADDAVRATARARLAEVLGPHVTDGGVGLGASVWLVGASA